MIHSLEHRQQRTLTLPLTALNSQMDAAEFHVRVQAASSFLKYNLMLPTMRQSLHVDQAEPPGRRQHAAVLNSFIVAPQAGRGHPLALLSRLQLHVRHLSYASAEVLNPHKESKST